MIEYYTRSEICNMFSPPVSRHYLRTLDRKGKIPQPTKKGKYYVYDKNEIDEWLATGRKYGERQQRMTNEDFDPWNIRKNKQNIQYSEEMTNLIMFLQPGLKNRNVGNALGS